MDLASLFDQAAAWIDQYIMNAPELAVFGAFAALVGVAAIALTILRGVLGAIAAVSRAQRDAAMARDKSPGYRVLLAAPSGARGRAAVRFLESALKARLPEFCFGAPVLIAPAGGPLPKVIDAIQARLDRSGADIVIGAAIQNAGPTGLRLRGVARAPQGVRSFQYDLSGDPKDWADDLAPVVAFLIAKAIQPAIAEPANFRSEKAAPVAETFGRILASDIDLPPDLRAELETRFCAFVLHVVEQDPSAAGLDRVISMRRAALDEKSGSPDARIAVRMDLGRALLISAERRFDQAIVAEAVGHLNQALEMMRVDPAIRKVETCSIALQKAQDMLASRKRFAISGGF